MKPTVYELRLWELQVKHDCDLCGRPGGRPYDYVSILDGSPVVEYQCSRCRTKIMQAEKSAEKES